MFGMENLYTGLQDFLELLGDHIVDAAVDTLYLIPFLLVTYLVLEFIEHRMSHKSQDLIKKAGVAGPIIGGILGLVPQCGFSSAASTFYAGRVIGLGTLFAVYLSTSDEMIPIFIAGGIPVQTLGMVLLIKLVIGIAMGFIVDFVLRISRKTKIGKNRKFQIHEMCERDNCSCDHEHSKNIIIPALIHTLQISLFVFLITLALNLIITFCGGADTLTQFVEGNKYASVVGSAIVGLIPNCAASVLISQLYVDGVLGFGALISGLLSSAGLGILVLLRTNRPVWWSVLIICGLLVTSIIFGLIICVFVV